MHAGIACDHHGVKIRRRGAGRLQRFRKQFIHSFPDHGGQFFRCMLHGVICPADHVGAELRLRIHRCFRSQDLTGFQVGKIKDDGGGTAVHGGRKQPSAFSEIQQRIFVKHGLGFI